MNDSRVAVGVLPARYASGRWPGKALAVVEGRPLVEWAWDTLIRTPGLSQVIVATDDERIVRWAQSVGAAWMLTSPECRNGTERVAEVARRIPASVYVNVQADQVGVEPRIVARLVREMHAHRRWDVGTLGTKIGLRAARKSPDRVLVASDRITSEGGRLATFFRRGGGRFPARRDLLRHLGVYLYRRDALFRYEAAEPTDDEVACRLEQLRALAIGLKIGLVSVRSWARSYDRPEEVVA